MNAEHVPAELRQRNQWVVWKHVTRNGEPTKVPFQPNGTEAKANDSLTWSSFAECQAVASRYEGLGYEFSSDDPFVGIDLDGCRNPETGELAPWARDIVLSLASYAEVSPSKTGVKIFCRGKSPFPTGRKCNLQEPKVSSKTPGIEIYDHLRYFAVTGKRLKGMSDLRDAQAEINAICEKYFPVRRTPRTSTWQSESEVMDRARKYVEQMPVAVSGAGGHNATFRVACVLVLGFGLSKGAAYQLLAEYSDRCDPPWTERELRHKIESAERQGGERNYLRDSDQDQWDTVEVPDYEPAAPKSNPKQPAAMDVRITTLKQATLDHLDKLEKGGSTIIKLGLGEVDESIGGGAEPGEMVVFAARPSHGKSAVALQSIHHWTLEGHRVAMISQEMSALALGKRSLQHISDVPEEHWFHSGEKMRQEIDWHFEKRKECWIIESCRHAEVAAEQIRRCHKEHGITAAVVDYLQLLPASGKNRYEQVTNASVCLRQVTSETGIILVALAQLNRQVESRSVFIPMMSDLKESGQIEQDADVIMFLVWPWKLDTKNHPNDYQFYIAKNRNRGIKTPAIKCRFVASRQMIMPQALKRVASLPVKKNEHLAQFERPADEF